MEPIGYPENVVNYQPINQRCVNSQKSNYLVYIYCLRFFMDLLICPARLEVSKDETN